MTYPPSCSHHQIWSETCPEFIPHSTSSSMPCHYVMFHLSSPLDTLHPLPSICNEDTCTYHTQNSATCATQHHCTEFSPKVSWGNVTGARHPSKPQHCWWDTSYLHFGVKGHVAVTIETLEDTSQFLRAQITSLRRFFHSFTQYQSAKQSYTFIFSTPSTLIVLRRIPNTNASSDFVTPYFTRSWTPDTSLISVWIGIPIAQRF